MLEATSKEGLVAETATLRAHMAEPVTNPPSLGREHWLQAQVECANVLVGADPAVDVRRPLLEALGQALGTLAAALWEPDADGRLRCTGCWATDEDAWRELIASEAASRAWDEREAVWGPPSVQNTPGEGRSFWRIAVPILPHDGNMGVLGLLTRGATGDIPALVETLAAIGTQYARFARRSMAQDVTDRARMQESLRASEQRYRTIVETAHEGVWILDAACRTTFANRQTAAMLGYQVEELADRSFLDFVPADERARLRGELLSGQGIPSPRDLCLYGREGRKVWVLLSATPQVDDAGRSAGSLLMLADITERRNLEEQFRQSQKMEALGRLAGGVAHDFNNLLTIINGYSELVLAMLPQGHAGRPRLQEVHRAGERATRLTRQLLAFSRQMVIEPRVLDLNSVLAESEKLIHRLIGEDIELTCVMAPALGRVKADPGHIDQVILNLVVNARDAMPTGGKLTIETANVYLDESYTRNHAEIQPGPFVLLAVSDTGCGMAPEVQARIFDPFFSTKEGGTGLGLATVYGIVRQSGGHINVYSEPGVGSSFKVYLPRVHEVVTPRLSAQGVRHLVPGAETVLIVEDEDAVRALTHHVLEEAGYSVLTASCGPEALQKIEEHANQIDLLVTDVIMPEMSGRELAESLLARFPTLKVLYVSGYTDDAVLRHGVLRAEVAFLQKPFSPGALTAKVRSVLDEMV